MRRRCGMSDTDWDGVNWSPTRRPLPEPNPSNVAYHRTPSLCRKTRLDTLAVDAERRRKWGARPKDYAAIPRCKLCERKARRP